MLSRRVVLVSQSVTVLFCCLLNVAISTGFGKCPVYTPLEKFDARRMSGTWYEVERSFYIMEMAASCVELQVTVSARQHLLITINQVNRWTLFPSTTYGIGVPVQLGSSQFRYKVNNRMPYVIGRMLPGAGYYQVLSTDYKRFAIVWSCTSYGIAHADNIWVLGREREFSAELRALIYTALDEMRLDPDRLIVSKNANCDNHTALYIRTAHYTPNEQ